MMMQNQGGYNAGMGMNMGVGGMGGMGMLGLNMGVVNGNTFIFRGNQMSFQAKIDSLTDIELQNIVDANISITGNEIKPINTCCIISTVMFGGCVIFPLCFMCCDWWKKCAYAAYQIQPAIYHRLARLLTSGTLRNLTLSVTDNLFDYPKAKILYDMLSNSRLIGFSFMNGATGYDYNNYEYTNFVASMRPIKQIPTLTSDIRWYTEIAL